MTVDTGKVKDRRKVRYGSVDELLLDAERVTNNPHRALGNWTAGQVFKHLAIVINVAIDGDLPVKPPWYLRVILRLMKRRVLTKGLPAGFQLPHKAARLVPDSTSTEEGLELLRKAISRWKSDPRRAPSPMFGRLSPDEADQLQLRHAELHMSFLVPT